MPRSFHWGSLSGVTPKLFQTKYKDSFEATVRLMDQCVTKTATIIVVIHRQSDDEWIRCRTWVCWVSIGGNRLLCLAFFRNDKCVLKVVMRLAWKILTNDFHLFSQLPIRQTQRDNRCILRHQTPHSAWILIGLLCACAQLGVWTVLHILSIKHLWEGILSF